MTIDIEKNTNDVDVVLSNKSIDESLLFADTSFNLKIESEDIKNDTKVKKIVEEYILLNAQVNFDKSQNNINYSKVLEEKNGKITFK